MRLGLYCACGDAAEGEMLPDSIADGFIAFWKKTHQGPQHRPCTKDEASAGRRRGEVLDFMGVSGGPLEPEWLAHEAGWIVAAKDGDGAWMTLWPRSLPGRNVFSSGQDAMRFARSLIDKAKSLGRKARIMVLKIAPDEDTPVE